MQALLAEMRGAAAWGALADWVERLRDLHGMLVVDRTEVASGIACTLHTLVDDGWVTAVAKFAERPATAGTASKLVAAAGPTIVAPLIRFLEGTAQRQAVVRAVSAHAAALAHELAARLDHPSAEVVRDLVTMLGHAGPGAECLVAAALAHRDDRVMADGCRALVRIGTAGALRIVSSQVGGKRARARVAADAFWQFPAALVGPETCRLLADHAFVSAHPRAARRLIQQAILHNVDGLRPVLERIATLRIRVWRPSQLWLGVTAARAARP
jgi:hypothetical protein